MRSARAPGIPVAEAAGFFEGFFEGAGQRLIHDAALRGAVDSWLMALDQEAFTPACRCSAASFPHWIAPSGGD
jgi:hypothetical protein